jgi:hypothetical protein
MPFDDDGQPLDNDESLREIKKWISDWHDATVEARKLSERDSQYYHDKQWTEEEIKALDERHQPLVTINRIKPKINAILGHEVRTRVDPEALPRTPQHEDEAPAITDALRYVADRERFDQMRSRVTEDMAIRGYGGVFVNVKQCNDGSYEVELIRCPYDRIVYDPHSYEEDFSDAHYVGLVTWRYRDEVLADYDVDPEVVDTALEGSQEGEDDEGGTLDDRPRFVWVNRRRKRLRVLELYYRHKDEWYVTHTIRTDFLLPPQKVAFVDERGKTVCPIVLVSAFINDDNERYGIVRAMISAQDEINKRRSKMLHLLSTRQVGYEEGAFLDPNKAREELAKPDGMVEFMPGGMERFQVLQTADLAREHFQLLQEAKSEIDSVGPNAQMIADANSGREYQARQQAATLELDPFFDNLRDWQHRVFVAIWQRIRQFWRAETWMRVRDDATHKGYRFVALNRRMTRLERLSDLVEHGTEFDDALRSLGDIEAGKVWIAVQSQAQQMSAQAEQAGQPIEPPSPEQLQQTAMAQMAQLPSMQMEFTANDVTRLDVDIVLSIAPDTAVVEQEEFERLAALAQLPGMQIPPDVIIEASQLRTKRKLLTMLEDARKEDPAAAQAAQSQAQMQMQLLQAQVQLLQSQAADNQARQQERAAAVQEKLAKTQLAIPAEAEKDIAIARRHESEAVGELQAQRLKDSDIGSPAALTPPNE